MVHKLILDPDADGTQWLYRGIIILRNDHPLLSRYSVYLPLGANPAHTLSECKALINNSII
jgi:hypothetical protein